MTQTAAAVPANILVVDDTIENLQLLATMLGDQGQDSSGDMSGYEVCAQLKARASSQDVPVIFLTALSETADKVRFSSRSVSRAPADVGRLRAKP